MEVRIVADTPKGQNYFGSDESRFATAQDEQRLSGENSPPALTDESGSPHFAKRHAPSQQEMSTHRPTEAERELRADSANTYQGSRGTPGAPPTED
jgi:hypothetical protein